MKKIIYLSAFLGIILMGCNPNEDIYNDIDGQENPVVGTDAFKMSSDDYAELSDETNNDFYETYESFSSIDDAKSVLPEFIADRYPFWGKGSSVTVDFNLFDGNPENVSDYINADDYELEQEDYPTAAANAFFPSEDPSDYLEDILENKIENPTEGQIVLVEYKQYIGQPSIGLTPFVSYDFAGSFDGWTATNVSGPQEWVSNQSYAQASGFSGGEVANEDWLVSPQIDLSNETNLNFQISQALNFADDVSLVEILVSKDYSGDVAAATWAPINLEITPAGNSNDFILSEDYDFSAYDGEMVNIAFKYTSTDSDAGRWRVEAMALKVVGISGETVTNTKYYQFDGSYWNEVDEAYYLSSDDYDSMGEESGQPGRFNNFSSSVLPENYLPQFLTINLPFAQEGEELFVIYKFFQGGDIGTVVKGNLYTVIDGVWSASISSLQFGNDGSTWVPDNTIAYTFSGGDYDTVSDALIDVYPGPAESAGNFGNFDRRVGNSNEWTDPMMLEAMNIILDDIDGGAAEGQKYLVTVDIYNGSSTTEDFAVIKTDGVWVYQE